MPFTKRSPAMATSGMVPVAGCLNSAPKSTFKFFARNLVVGFKKRLVPPANRMVTVPNSTKLDAASGVVSADPAVILNPAVALPPLFKEAPSPNLNVCVAGISIFPGFKVLIVKALVAVVFKLGSTTVKVPPVRLISAGS